MRKYKFNKVTYVSLILAIICSITLLVICWQEDILNDACVAIQEGRSEDAIVHLEELWDLEMLNKDKETALMTACRVGDSEVIYYLIEKRVNLNYAPPGKMTPLELFCRYGYKNGYETVVSMLKSGAKQSKYTLKPALFHLAEQFYWMDKKEKPIATELSIILLQHGAPMGYGDTSILHLAAEGNMDEFFYTVVHTSQGLQIMTMKDGQGRTPWQVAVEKGAVGVQRVIRDLEKESGLGQDPFEDANIPTIPVLPPDDEDDEYYPTDPTPPAETEQEDEEFNLDDFINENT